MKLRRLSITTTLTVAFLTMHSMAQTAAEWAVAEKAKLDTITPAALVEIAKGAPESYNKLFAEVKTGYKSDPVELTRIAALTQLITKAARPETRNDYANALLDAATKAQDADVACFFIDQLRWCATPNQSAGIKALTQSDKEGVAAIAAIAVLASEGNIASQQKDAKTNVYSEYSAQIAKLNGTQKFKALVAGFNNADPKIAGIAMREAAQLDIQDQIKGMSTRQAESINKRRLAAGKAETKLWCEQLDETSDAVKLAMLIDMLGARGCPEATAPLAEYIGHADTTVAYAAQMAMLKIDPLAYVTALPTALRNLPDTHADTIEKVLMCVPLTLVEEHLIGDFNSYSMSAKKIVLFFLSNRRSPKAIALALEAINSTAKDQSSNGYRVLRDCAGVEEAELLMKKLMREQYRRSGPIQEAVAGAAKRDQSGTYLKMLDDAWKNANAEQQQSLMGTYSRIGDMKFLARTQAEMKNSNEEIATVALRSVTGWNNIEVVPTLLKLAYTSQDKKHRILAQRSVVKMLSAKDIDKAKWKAEWDKVKAGAGDEAMKKIIDDVFKK